MVIFPLFLDYCVELYLVIPSGMYAHVQAVVLTVPVHDIPTKHFPFPSIQVYAPMLIPPC